MFKHFFLSILLIGIGLYCQAQNAYEALRYSQNYTGGTARGIGAGSAFGALGADMTSIGINPGGLGVYRSSEALFSLGINSVTSTSNFNNNEQNKINLAVPNFGVVINKSFLDKRGNRSRGKWISLNFAFNYNRTQNFGTKRFYENNIDAQTLLPIFANNLNGLNPSSIDYSSANLESVLAYAGFLINPELADTTSYNSVTDNIPIDKQILVNTIGRMDEANLAIAANYNEKIFFGATLGIPFLRYTEDVTYAEYDRSADINGINFFEMTRFLQTRGTGINLKLGAVFRAAKWLRLGAAVHTPTAIRLRDNFNAQLFSDLDTIAYESQSPVSSFKYRLRTPLRFVASAAFLIKKYGFISADYEFANNKGIGYRYSSDLLVAENNTNIEISNTLVNTHTIRVGAEGVIKKFRLRAGYNLVTNPINTTFQLAEEDKTYQSISGGVGYRGEKFNIDAAYVRSVTDNSVLFSNTIVSADKITRGSFIISFGIRF